MRVSTDFYEDLIEEDETISQIPSTPLPGRQILEQACYPWTTVDGFVLFIILILFSIYLYWLNCIFSLIPIISKN
jgi:hypothetical protein